MLKPYRLALLALLISGTTCFQAIAEETTPDIEKRVADLERLLQNQGLLDLWEQLHALQSELAKLRGQLEVNNHEIKQLKEKQRKLYNDLDSRLQTLSKQANEIKSQGEPSLGENSSNQASSIAGTEGESLTIESAKQPAGTGEAIESLPESGAAETGRPDPVEIQSAYQSAFRLLKQAEYDQAITAFSLFLQEYPNSQYADNARYWMGEAYFVTRRFGQAITEYRTLLDDFPDSRKAPVAMLKIGHSYRELGQSEESKKYYRMLVEKYPDTSAAKDAARELEQT
jgi:tol-pal system protein YbgF